MRKQHPHSFLHMKRIIPCLLALALTLAVQAQTLKINVFAPVSLGYEHPLGRNSSVQATLHYAIFLSELGSGYFMLADPSHNISTATASLEYRYYMQPSHAPQTGFFVGGYNKYTHYEQTRTWSDERDGFATTDFNLTARFDKLSLGYFFGYQKRIARNIYAEAFFGQGATIYGRYRETHSPANSLGDVYSLHALSPKSTRFCLAFGYRFPEHKAQP